MRLDGCIVVVRASELALRTITSNPLQDISDCPHNTRATPACASLWISNLIKYGINEEKRTIISMQVSKGAYAGSYEILLLTNDYDQVYHSVEQRIQTIIVVRPLSMIKYGINNFEEKRIIISMRVFIGAYTGCVAYHSVDIPRHLCVERHLCWATWEVKQHVLKGIFKQKGSGVNVAYISVEQRVFLATRVLSEIYAGLLGNQTACVERHLR